MKIRPSKEQKLGDKESVSLRIRAVKPPDLPPASYVNHVEATFAGTEFVLTLCQVVPPSTRPGEPPPKEIEQGFIDARVVAQYFIPTRQLIDTVRNIQKLIDTLVDRGVIQIEETDGSS